MVVRVNEEVFTLTMPEAEYCLKVCELAALGTSGSDLSNTFSKLHTRLEAELHKPVNLDVSLSAEEKNELVKAVMIYELLVREKYDVLRDHFNLQNMAMFIIRMMRGLSTNSSGLRDQQW